MTNYASPDPGLQVIPPFVTEHFVRNPVMHEFAVVTASDASPDREGPSLSQTDGAPGLRSSVSQ